MRDPSWSAEGKERPRTVVVVESEAYSHSHVPYLPTGYCEGAREDAAEGEGEEEGWVEKGETKAEGKPARERTASEPPPPPSPACYPPPA